MFRLRDQGFVSVDESLRRVDRRLFDRTTQNSTPLFRPSWPGGANMRTTIRRDDVVDLVIGNRRPLAVYFDFVMVADHTALSRATVHEVAAGAFAIVSVQLRVEALMPFIVACPVISFLRRCAYTKKHGERAAEKRDELAAFHSMTSSARLRSVGGTSRPSALAALRLMARSIFVGCCTGRSAGFSPLRMRST
jgi:hypothetical protein